jgi:hypothetical protein
LIFNHELIVWANFGLSLRFFWTVACGLNSQAEFGGFKQMTNIPTVQSQGCCSSKNQYQSTWASPPVDNSCSSIPGFPKGCLVWFSQYLIAFCSEDTREIWGRYPKSKSQVDTAYFRYGNHQSFEGSL